MAAKQDRNRKTSGTSPDPFLRSFLRQAVAIIAAEKGLTDSSRAKLRKIASELGLSEKAFDEAMEQLKTPGSSLGLNRYEQKFSELVSTELKKFKGDVLSIRYEKRLADLAQTKYQIPPVRAHQLIQKAAEQQNIGIISHSDAQQFVQNLVEDTVGNQNSISQTEIEKLASIGEKWGIAKNATYRQVTKLTSQNRIRQKIAATKRFAFYGACLVSILVATWALQRIEWTKVFKNEPSAQNSVTSPSDNKITYPDWWTDRMIEVSLGFNRRLRNRLHTTLKSVDTANLPLTEFYSDLVTTTVNRPAPNPMDSFVLEAFYRQPDSANAILIADQLTGIFNMPDQSQVSAGNIRRSKRAAQLLVELYFYDEKNNDKLNSRHQQIVDRIGANADNPPSFTNKNQLLNLLTDSLSLQLWTISMQSSQSNPKTTAASLAELEEFSLKDSPEINELRLRTCQRIITTAPIQWNNIRLSINKSIHQSNRSNIQSWIRLAIDKSLPSELRIFLAESLSKKLKINSTSTSALFDSLENLLLGYSIANVDQQLQGCQIVESEIQKLNNRLRVAGISKFDESKAKIPKDQLPELIQSVAETNNMLLEWLNKKATPKLPDTSNKHSDKLTKTNFPPLVTPTPSQRRQFKESISRLTTTDPNTSSSRIRAVSRLRELAASFQAVSQEHAVILAKYILGINTPQEQLAIERALPDFKQWVRLKLAMADQLQQTTIPRSELSNYFDRLAIQTENELDSNSDWFASMRLAILNDCLAILQTRQTLEPDSLMWSAFVKLYSTEMDRRIHNIVQDGNTSSLEQSLGNALHQQPYWLQNHIDLLASKGKLERWILTNWIVAAFVSQQQQIELPSNSGSSGSAGRDLLRSELVLFRVLHPVFERRFEMINGAGT